ncbi:hypothetical protein OsI_22434 [Oryza sativa Indica Group]|uniref:Uncharacterized protein n=1 Tax=Oryza sativa subsp. indica TaxID=39946 RepID=B8B0B7_ORYSI|nr:hypothetical protein OsI_22434 [Oryza sativa Indica Group]
MKKKQEIESTADDPKTGKAETRQGHGSGEAATLGGRSGKAFIRDGDEMEAWSRGGGGVDRRRQKQRRSGQAGGGGGRGGMRGSAEAARVRVRVVKETTGGGERRRRPLYMRCGHVAAAPVRLRRDVPTVIQACAVPAQRAAAGAQARPDCRAGPAQARTLTGRAMLGPGQTPVPWAGPSGCRPYGHL